MPKYRVLQCGTTIQETFPFRNLAACLLAAYALHEQGKDCDIQQHMPKDDYAPDDYRAWRPIVRFRRGGM